MSQSLWYGSSAVGQLRLSAELITAKRLPMLGLACPPHASGCPPQLTCSQRVAGSMAGSPRAEGRVISARAN